MRKKLRINHRIIALFMAAVMFLTSMSIAGSLIPMVASAADNVVIRDDALHFIIRHWHTDFDNEANHQGGQQEEGDENNFFVLLEGYIIPKAEDEKEYEDDNFTIVLINQGTGKLVKASTLYDADGNPTTPYLGKLDKKTGVIEIMVKPLRDENKSADSGYDDLENFSGFSMSAGRGAVSYIYDKYEGEGDSQAGIKGTETGIRITYSKYPHLVKGHFFYSSWNKTVPGTSDPAVFDPKNEEIDTAEVYTWIESVNGHTAGEIVKYTDEENDTEVACKTEEDLTEKARLEELNLDELKAAVTLTKFYSTNEGLHTNKTLTQLSDGRLFLFDLEAWYVEGYAPQLGFILDASGGMAFPSDTPTVINVYAALLDQLRTLGVSKNSDNKYVYDGRVYDDPETLFRELEKLEGVGHKAIVKALSEVVERTVTEDDVHGLLDKIGELDRQNDGTTHTIYEYPQHDKLIGYYEFVGNNGTDDYTGYRTWGLNNVDANVAKSSEFRYENFNESYFTKEVTQGTETDGFDFSEWKTMYNGFPNHPLNFSNNLGFNIGGVTAAGVLLNKTPENSFTLSFTSDVNTTSDPAEILYIGPSTGEKNSAEFRMTGEKGSFNIYCGGENIWTAKASGKTRITLVYNGSRLAIYLDSVLSQTVNLLLSASNIVFAPFIDNFTSNFYIDDVFLYDTALKGSEVVQLVTAYSNGKGINDSSTAAINWNEVFIDDDALMLLLNPRNTVHTPLGVAAYNYYVGPIANMPLGYWDGTVNSDVSSAVKDTNVISTEEGVNLGIIYNSGKPGWYAVSHGGNATDVTNLLGGVGSAKRFFGRKSTLSGFDTIETIDGTSSNSADTGAEYPNTQKGASLFYIDSQGDLRCFYGGNANGSSTLSETKLACSYVYCLEDSQYVKTEALQRVLANFTTKLAEDSPSSQISAVRFSTDAYADAEGGLDSLVLLDWTDDPVEVSKMMSQVRGDGTANRETGYDESAAGVKQYNYALTGGTYVYTALKAFYNTLIMDKDNNRRDNADAPKFVVIFTDGEDNDITSYDSVNDKITIGTETKKAVNAVKEKGYTIITVYTPEAGATDLAKAKAKAFLTAIAGTKDENDGEEYFFESTDLNELSRIFDEQLLSQLTSKVEGYTVQDYIDPRFDLQNADGTVWKLRAGGRVEKFKDGVNIETIDVTQKNPKTKDYYTFHLAGSSTPSARDPYLLYDGAKDMYYMKWVDQTIPSSAVGSKELLPVWNAEVMLRAKDDFIGGNTILTNGNEKNMNWLYHPADISKEAYDEYFKDWDEDENGDKKVSEYDASSGTDDMYKLFKKITVDDKLVNDYDNPIDEFPSKGFPRTTANVRLLPIDTKDNSNIIYLGEAVSPKQILMEIGDDYITDSYYLDYLKRYAYQRYDKAKDEVAKAEMNMPLMDLLAEWLEMNNDNEYKKEFSIPYMYLPSVAYDDDTGKIIPGSTKFNNTGNDIHEQDVVGILTYRWEQLAPDPNSFDEPIKNFVKNNTNRIVYSLTVEFTPLRVGDTLEKLNSAVPETTAFTAYGAPIVAAQETEDGGIMPLRVLDGIFAEYVPIEGGKSEFNDTFLFDREKYVNGRLIQEKDKDGKDVYQWNKGYKPEAFFEQVESDETTYGNAAFLNNGRTLTAFSHNIIDAVGGGIALEMKVLIGELEEAAAKHGGKFEKEFTVNATRSFQDAEWVEKIKARRSEWEDFGNDFTITFKFDYDAAKIAELKADVLANSAKYPKGYVSIYAVTTNIIANKANFTNIGKNLTELPIGTYDFSLDDINEQLKDVLDGDIHFATVGYDTNDEHFDVDYFDKSVLNGLHMSNSEEWREKRDENGNIMLDENGNIIYENAAEIDNDNITDFKAGASTVADKKTVSFYIGTVARDNKTSADKYVPTRGNAGENPYDTERYTNDRLAIFLLSSGMAQLTIVEDGAQSNENFLYRITGMTLGYKEVKDLIVSVKGGGSTTIDILPGVYTVTEISDWSWRYKNKNTYGATPEQGWTITDQFKKASTTFRYTNDDPVEEHKTVIYVHERNTKVWLGSENSKDNLFGTDQ